MIQVWLPNNELKDMLTFDEVRRTFGVSRETLRRWARLGKLTVYHPATARQGCRNFYLAEEIERLRFSGGKDWRK